MKRLTVACLACVLVLALALPALAHKVFVFAYSDTETIFVEAQFSKSSPAIECPVDVADADGNVLATCTTDADGTCEIPVPEDAAGDLIVTVHAGEGHQATWELLEVDYK